MAIRVYSGILVTRGFASGNAVINFATHTVSGTLRDSTHHKHKRQHGGIGEFERTPCKMVALREIKTEETEWTRAKSHEGKERDYFRINDSEINRHRLEIEWRATGGSQIEEISYMVIGEGA